MLPEQIPSPRNGLPPLPIDHRLLQLNHFLNQAKSSSYLPLLSEVNLFLHSLHNSVDEVFMRRLQLKISEQDTGGNQEESKDERVPKEFSLFLKEASRLHECLSGLSQEKKSKKLKQQT